MSTTKQLTNVRVSTAAQTLGANTKRGLPFVFNDMASFFLIRSDAFFAATNDFNVAAFTTLQKEGKLEIFHGVKGVELAGADDNIATSPNGSSRKTINGKYQFVITFYEDFFFQSVLASFESNGLWYFGAIDSKGNILMRKLSNGNDAGFTTGMIAVNKATFGGTDGASNSIIIELDNRNELDSQYAYIDNNNINFSPLEIEPVIQVYVTPTTIPQQGDTTILVSAFLQRGLTDSIPSFTNTTDWVVNVNGSNVTVSAAAYNATTEEYTLTVPAFGGGDDVNVSLNGIIEVVGDGLYKSQSTNFTSINI